jgi:hypothetical protein
MRSTFEKRGHVATLVGETLLKGGRSYEPKLDQIQAQLVRRLLDRLSRKILPQDLETGAAGFAREEPNDNPLRWGCSQSRCVVFFFCWRLLLCSFLPSVC